MTKLKSADIKGIIEERGSNVFDVIIDVPSNIFSRPESEQSGIVAKEIFGFSIKSKILKSIMFNGAAKSIQKMKVKATLEFSNEAIEELVALEISIEEGKKNAVTLLKPLTAAEAMGLSEKGVTSFILQVPFGIVRAGEREQRKYIASSIVQGLEVYGFTVSPHSYDSGVTTSTRGVYVNVLIPDFKETAKEVAILKDTEDSIYATLEDEGTRLYTPLEELDIEQIKQDELSAVDENEVLDLGQIYHEFNYLVEVEYDTLVSMDVEDIYYHVRNKVLLETLDGVEVEELNHEAVGFNPISKQVILMVEGALSIAI